MPGPAAAPTFELTPDRGWIAGVRRAPSPHFDQRPAGATVDLLIVHGISLPVGSYGGPHVEALFCGRLDPSAHPSFAEIARQRVTAHALVRRDGEVVQFCSFHDRAWHAGPSAFGGREACNDFSIGIELEGCDTDPYEAPQYEALAGLARTLMAGFPGITPARIVGHCDVAPGRKTDPGPAFDWRRLRAQIGTASRS